MVLVHSIQFHSYDSLQTKHSNDTQNSHKRMVASSTPSPHLKLNDCCTVVLGSLTVPAKVTDYFSFETVVCVHV